MAGRKTRAVVDCQGSERLLFSVQENSQGGLTIIINQNYSDLNNERQVIGQRISVHESINTSDGGFLVKRTVKLQDTSNIESYAYVKPNEGHAMLHTLGQLESGLTRAPVFSKKPKDTVVKFYDNFVDGNLFYLILVSKFGLSAGDLKDLGLKVIEMRFKTYALFMLTGIFHSVAPIGGISAYLMSMPSRRNGIPDRWATSKNIPTPISPRAHQIPFLVGEMIDNLAEAAKAVLKQQRWADGSTLSEREYEHLAQGYDWYSNEPSILTITNRIRASAKRLSNPPKDLWIPTDDSEAMGYIVPGKE
jgi:hypothetical protein